MKVIPNIGIYRNEGPAVTHTNDKATEHLAEDLARVLQKECLKIRVIVNKNSVNFLDVKLNLKKNTTHTRKKMTNTCT